MFGIYIHIIDRIYIHNIWYILQAMISSNKFYWASSNNIIIHQHQKKNHEHCSHDNHHYNQYKNHRKEKLSIHSMRSYQQHILEDGILFATFEIMLLIIMMMMMMTMINFFGWCWYHGHYMVRIIEHIYKYRSSITLHVCR